MPGQNSRQLGPHRGYASLEFSENVATVSGNAHQPGRSAGQIANVNNGIVWGAAWLNSDRRQVVSVHGTCQKSTITTRMDAVERLTMLFKLERQVHLFVTSLSLLMLLASAGVLIFKGTAGPAELGLFSGHRA